jgi:small conductance mechanosensitive channel
MTTIEEVIAKIMGKFENWIDTFILMLPNFFIAVIVLLLFYFVARLLTRGLDKTLDRFSSNIAVNRLISSIFHFVIVIIGLFVALGILNLDKTVTSLLAGVGIAGLAIGLAFKDVAANFLAGIYMAIKSPVNVGDLIEYEEHYGRISKIGLRATVLTTLQGQDVVIPNRYLMENPYVHYTINKIRRIDLNVGISYGDNLDKVEKVTLEAINGIEFLKKDKPVDFYYLEFGSSSINFVTRYWVNFKEETDYLKALSEGIRRIKKAYDQNDITITFPIRTLDFGIKGGKTLAEMLGEVRGDE